MNLSKSRYTKGVQCPKMLWMDQHMPELFDTSVLNQTVLDNGSAVGDLAMGYYGEFVEVPFQEHGKSQMVQDTERFVKAALEGTGPVNVCEASFALDGNFCSVDILRVEPDGVHIVEVKSSTHVRDIYLHDMAYQTWLLARCGMTVKSVSLMHVNNGYVRQGEIDLQQLFAVEDCSVQVASMLPEVGEYVEQLKWLADQAEEPAIPIGCHCNRPYPCGYRAWCWKDVPKPSVFDLFRLTTEKALAYAGAGTVTLQDLAATGAKLSARQQVQVDAEVQGVELVVDQEAVSSFLDGLTFPLYFLDFEAFQPAVPQFDGTKPYQQIPSQYSLHVLRSAQSPLEHYEYLAQAGCDPRRGVAEHLVADIPADVCVLAYNMSYEKGRIREMAEAYPDLAEHLMSIHDNVKDLIVPFQKGSCYARAMGGSNSIKAVLPAFFPNDPALDYHALEDVHNGSEASAVFESLAGMEEERAAHLRERLLRYCELDTLAMVKLYQKLCELAGR